MAKAKTKKDSTLPLIIALVFFVLTTIVFGIMWYTTNDQIAAKEEAAKSAEAKVTASRSTITELEQTNALYKMYVGVGNPKDQELVGQIKDGDATSAKAVAALTALNKAVAEKENPVAGGEKKEGEPEAPAAKAAELKLAYWQPAFNADKTLSIPDAANKGGLIQKAVDNAATRAAADERAATDRRNLAPAAAAANEKAKAHDNARDAYAKASAGVTDQYVNKATEARKSADDNRKNYDKKEVDARNLIKKKDEEIEDLKLKIQRLDEQVAAALKNNRDIQDRLVKTQDIFQYDEPQGRITRRVNDDVVEIDLGWVARVRPGLTFSVLPRDFPEKGRQSRMQVVRVPDAKGNFQSVERFNPKATLEVIEILGPNSARARIAGEDAIRDKVLPGDLLYNSIWRKGQADHIALVGVFDVNGDGADDIETVVKDMNKMGVPVDAIFDLRTQKWVGRITEQTRYVVQGAFPSNSGADPHREAKTKLLDALAAALADARAKGVTITNYRDFFPRMGYRVKQDVSEDKVNQAAAKYLSGGVVGQPDAPPQP